MDDGEECSRLRADLTDFLENNRLDLLSEPRLHKSEQMLTRFYMFSVPAVLFHVLGEQESRFMIAGQVLPK